MKIASKIWIGAAVSLTLAQIAASALMSRGMALTAVSDVVCALMILTIMLAFVWNGMASHGRLRKVWILMAAGWSFSLAGHACWIYFDILVQRPMPDMYLGDLVVFMAGVPTLAGMLLRPHVEPNKSTSRLGIFDFLQLMLWWVYFYVYLVMCWQYGASNLELYNLNYDRLYSLQILVQIIVLGLLLILNEGAWRRFYGVFLGVVVFHFLAVLFANHAIENGSYFGGSWIHTAFIASLACFMIVAMMGRDLKQVPETRGDEKYNAAMESLAALAVLSLPLIVVTTTMVGHAPGEVIQFRILATAVAMFVMAGLVFIKQHRLHHDLREINRTLVQASITDPLTGIRNRRYLTATIEADVARTLRAYTGAPDRSSRDLVFYLVDLDNFKQVNDRYGHDAGDRVLIETARRLGSVVRAADVLVRWGGEEFLIVSRSADRRYAEGLAVRVLNVIRDTPFDVGTAHAIHRTCSVGWAAFPWRPDDVHLKNYEEIINLADRALGQAKQAGKDQVIGMYALKDSTSASISSTQLRGQAGEKSPGVPAFEKCSRLTPRAAI